jgi:hypothetical protein
MHLGPLNGSVKDRGGQKVSCLVCKFVSLLVAFDTLVTRDPAEVDCVRGMGGEILVNLLQEDGGAELVCMRGKLGDCLDGGGVVQV